MSPQKCMSCSCLFIPACWSVGGHSLRDEPRSRLGLSVTRTATLPLTVSPARKAACGLSNRMEMDTGMATKMVTASRRSQGDTGWAGRPVPVQPNFAVVRQRLLDKRRSMARNVLSGGLAEPSPVAVAPSCPGRILRQLPCCYSPRARLPCEREHPRSRRGERVTSRPPIR